MKLLDKSPVKIDPNTFEPYREIVIRLPLQTLVDLSVVPPDEAALIIGRAFLEMVRK